MEYFYKLLSLAPNMNILTFLRSIALFIIVGIFIYKVTKGIIVAIKMPPLHRKNNPPPMDTTVSGNSVGKKNGRRNKRISKNSITSLPEKACVNRGFLPRVEEEESLPEEKEEYIPEGITVQDLARYKELSIPEVKEIPLQTKLSFKDLVK